MTAAERKCVMTWLLLDKKLRRALQDAVGEGWTAEAAVKLVRRETGRMSKQQFVRGMREMAAGLSLSLSDATIHLLFQQVPTRFLSPVRSALSLRACPCLAARHGAALAALTCLAAAPHACRLTPTATDT